MTRKLDFRSVCEKLGKIFKPGIGSSRDVQIMISLGFSPTSWKVWRPKLIEYCLDEEYYFDNSDEKFEIFYDKKK